MPMSFPQFWTVVVRCIAAGDRTEEGPVVLTNHKNYDWSRDLGHPMRPRLLGDPEDAS